MNNWNKWLSRIGIGDGKDLFHITEAFMLIRNHQVLLLIILKETGKAYSLQTLWQSAVQLRCLGTQSNAIKRLEITLWSLLLSRIILSCGLVDSPVFPHFRAFCCCIGKGYYDRRSFVVHKCTRQGSTIIDSKESFSVQAYFKSHSNEELAKGPFLQEYTLQFHKKNYKPIQHILAKQEMYLKVNQNRT